MTASATITTSAPARQHLDRDDEILLRLLAHAYLFDDPRAYEAGVRDALAAMRGSQEAKVSGAA